MWHTSRGDRTLQGAEAELVCTAIDMMIDALSIHLEDEFDEGGTICESGVPFYDAFSASQRIGLLHDVATHLLIPTEQPLELSAALEATVAAIFVDIRDQVAIEIDFPAIQFEPSYRSGDDLIGEGDPFWRRLVLAAYQSLLRSDSLSDSCPDLESIELPDATCPDIERWNSLVESLADAILWDRDFEMADIFLDADPGVSQQRRRLLGISEDYFTSVAPDPRPSDVVQLVSQTRRIVRQKPR